MEKNVGKLSKSGSLNDLKKRENHLHKRQLEKVSEERMDLQCLLTCVHFLCIFSVGFVFLVRGEIINILM